MKEIKIGGKLVGDGHPCFIIAEAGVNHNGDKDLALELIKLAKEAGADAIKFQTFKTERLTTKDARKATYQERITGADESQFEMIKKLELGQDDFKDLAEFARKENLIFLSTPFDIESADLLSELQMPAFKIASGEITNLPFIKHIARKGRPIILSTGMATLGEIDDALQAIKTEGLEDIILLHCVTDYPAIAEDVNLRVMDTLRCAFKLPTGFSDHTQGIYAALAAVTMGACVIEKHFTVNRNLPGPDHLASLEPDELKQMVEGIRYIEKLLGNGIKRPTCSEEETKKVVRKSLVSCVDISAGTEIAPEMLVIKRPGTGIEPKNFDRVIGMRARRDIKSDEILTWDKIE